MTKILEGYTHDFHEMPVRLPVAEFDEQTLMFDRRYEYCEGPEVLLAEPSTSAMPPL